MNWRWSVNRADFLAYEQECIRSAAGRSKAEIRPVAHSEGLRSRIYCVEGPEGDSFVKCQDAGYINPSHFVVTLEHEAEGLEFFAPLDDGLMGVPKLHFFQSFPGSGEQQLQVLGMDDLTTLGRTSLPRDVYQDLTVPLDSKEQIAALCGEGLARIVSPNFQASLDRGAGVASVRRRTDAIMDAPNREEILASMEHHLSLPWAYQNKILGEMNVLLPRWLAAAGRETDAETQVKLDRIDRLFSSPQMIDALSPGHSSDRIVFSPVDRHDGNTLVVMDELGEVRRLFEIDLEFWGLETMGRLIGRYMAAQNAAMRSLGWQGKSGEPAAREVLEGHYRRVMGSFLFHFVQGDATETPEMALRAVSTGLAGFHAAIFLIYVAAVFSRLRAPAQLPSRMVDDALGFLQEPRLFLTMAAEYAASRSGVEVGWVLDTVKQIRSAMEPLCELASNLLA